MVRFSHVLASDFLSLGLPYSQFMDAVQQSNIAINRKMLAELAVTEPFSFQALAAEVSKVCILYLILKQVAGLKEYIYRFKALSGETQMRIDFLKRTTPSTNRLRSLRALKWLPISVSSTLSWYSLVSNTRLSERNTEFQ